uniref:Uncharacterized protein n=1 Tax=Zea mays TaxID=4577 RepID=C0PCH9_MAIZE|nr:unknown [Zea mays]
MLFSQPFCPFYLFIYFLFIFHPDERRKNRITSRRNQHVKDCSWEGGGRRLNWLVWYGYLGEQQELLHSEGACGGERVEREVDDGVVCVPACALTAARVPPDW